MENVTDRLRNPFGVDYPCEDGPPVTSYGDANADVHLVGDHPGVHGGRESGVPFDAPAVAPLVDVLRAVGLVEDAVPTSTPGDDGTDGSTDAAPYVPRNLFCSYLHACPTDGRPTEAAYDRLEPSFDAELRAVAAHVLVPVGDRALAHVLAEYTSKGHRLPADAAAVHARELPGRGFLVVPA
ncbi:uracil-DNA glycosylase, partial [Halobacteriales archaeon SW_12_71_31]